VLTAFRRNFSTIFPEMWKTTRKTAEKTTERAVGAFGRDFLSTDVGNFVRNGA